MSQAFYSQHKDNYIDCSILSFFISDFSLFSWIFTRFTLYFFLALSFRSKAQANLWLILLFFAHPFKFCSKTYLLAASIFRFRHSKCTSFSTLVTIDPSLTEHLSIIEVKSYIIYKI